MSFVYSTLWAPKQDNSPVPPSQANIYWGAADISVASSSLIAIENVTNTVSSTLGFVYAAYRTSVSQSIPSSTGSIVTVVNYDLQETDTYGAVTVGPNWRFTLPTGQDGYYKVAAAVAVAGNLNTPNASSNVSIYKNGNDFRRGVRVTHISSSANPTNLIFSTLTVDAIVLLTGTDYIDVRAYQNSGLTWTTESPLSAAPADWITIFRIPGSQV